MARSNSEAKKSRPHKAGGFEFGENVPNVDYGAYVIVRIRRDAGDRDRDALREARRIVLVGDRVERLDVGRRPDQCGERHRRDTVLEVVLVSAGRKLAGVVQDRLVLRVRADLLEGRDRHGGQEADDDDDDHDFDKGEALGGVACDFHVTVSLFAYFFL
jgi:hypothetical protein